MRYFIVLSYNGGSFHGWQKQGRDKQTIQYQIDYCLQTLLRNPEIETVGCGRTDAGVHARNFIAHFEHENIELIDDIVYHTNKMLSKEIAIHKIVKVHDNAHARFDAYSRTYTYSINDTKNPFELFSTYYSFGKQKVDLALFNEMASHLIGKKDFHFFCKTNGSSTGSICTVYDAFWKMDSGLLTFHITANRFLRGMIRLLVGAMLNVHRGKLTIEQWQAALNNEQGLPLSWSAPANGLCLQNILYSYINAETHEYFEEFLV